MARSALRLFPVNDMRRGHEISMVWRILGNDYADGTPCCLSSPAKLWELEKNEVVQWL